MKKEIRSLATILKDECKQRIGAMFSAFVALLKFWAWRCAVTGTTVVLALHLVCPVYLSAERRAKQWAGERIDRMAMRLGYLRPFDMLSGADGRTWQDIADEQADLQGLNRCLIRAMIKIESVNGTQLVSPAGALGHMQLMAPTAAYYGLKTDEQRMNPEENIYAGTKHIRELIEQYGLFLGLQVYNAGIKRVGKTKENIEYPHKVLNELARCETQRTQQVAVRQKRKKEMNA